MERLRKSMKELLMHPYYDKALETMIKGWTRIDMLIAIYDRTIEVVRAAKAADESNDASLLNFQLIDASRCLLALHSGLNTDEPIANDVARLLNFISFRLESKDFDEAIGFLKKLHATFSAIREEASTLERDGKIPPLNGAHTLNTVA